MSVAPAPALIRRAIEMIQFNPDETNLEREALAGKAIALLNEALSGCQEIVICAAVKSKSGRIFRGHRHGNCFIAIIDACLEPGHGQEMQGFMTSLNRFVNRVEGMKIQKAAGIPSAAQGGYRGEILFSEDLY